jgi:phage baseplate assembly protein gpV
MTVSVPFQQQDTFRKLGYLYFTDSLNYREVLSQNAQWKVTELPPVGAQLHISPSENSGGTPGGLTQGSFIFGLPNGEAEQEVYPFDTREEYDLALYRYTLQGVVNRESINGYSFDSVIAITGDQNG